MRLFDHFRRGAGGSRAGELLGCWHFLRSDADPQGKERAEMDFRPGGQLDYAVDAGDRWQIMKLTYRVERDRIVTDQPSAPDKIVTKFAFLEDGSLLLDLDGERSWYRRGDRRAPAV